jgi:WD40 repeat protein
VTHIEPPGGTTELVFSPDGTHLATTNDELANVWDLSDGRSEITDPEHRLVGQTSVAGIDWTSDGRFLATGSNDGTARVWDATTGLQVLRLAGHTSGLGLVSFSPDGTELLTGGGDGTARVWDITPTGTAEAFGASEPFGILSVSYAPDGSTLLTSGFIGRGWLWDAEDGTRLQGFADMCCGAAFGSEGTQIATLNYLPDRDMLETRDASTGEPIQEMQLDGRLVSNMAFSADASSVAASLEDGHAVIFDASTGKPRTSDLGDPAGPFDQMAAVAFSPDGTMLAGISGLATLYLWDATSGEEIFRVQAHTGEGTRVTFSPDGKTIATGGLDGAALWDLSGHRIRSFAAAGRIGAVAFSPDGTELATGGDDGMARIWSVASGRQIVVLSGNTDAVLSLAFSPDGTRLATGGIDATLRVFVLPVNELATIARSRLTRGLSGAECAQYLHLTPCPASVRTVHPPTGSTIPDAIGPEGAFRVDVAPSDLPVPPFSKGDVESTGTYTWYLMGGAWRYHQDAPDGFRDEWAGTYDVSRDRITFTVAEGDPPCLGTTWTARWSLQDASTLSLTDASATVPSACDPERMDAWVQAVLETHPWHRVS